MSIQSFFGNIKKKLYDNEGWFRGGDFTPIKQINTMRGIPTVPKLPQPTFTPQPTLNQSIQRQTPLIPEPTYLQPPKPTFKTESANNLSSRLDLIKRFGTSDLSKINTPEANATAKPNIKTAEPNNFWDSPAGKNLVKAQEFTQPIADNMSKSVARYKEDPTRIITEGIPALAKGIYRMGVEGPWNLGKNLVESQYAKQDAQRMLDQAKAEGELANKQWAKVRQLESEGNFKGAEIMRKFILKSTVDNRPKTDEFIKNIDKKKIETILAGVKTAQLLPGVGQIKPSQYLFGGTVGGVTNLVTGKDPFEGAGEGIASVKASNLLLQGANPVENAIVNSTLKNIVSPATRAIISRSLSGVLNMAEDEALAKLENKNPGASDRLMSFAIGVILNSSAGKTDYDINSLKKDIRKQIKTKGGMNESFKLDPASEKKVDEIANTIKSLVLNPDGSLKVQKGAINFGAEVGSKKPNLTLEQKQRQQRMNNASSIDEILTNKKIDQTKTPINVKGKPIDVNKLESEGWKLDQIDYAIKLANDAKLNPDSGMNYVRGILKRQYPNQASKMGKPLPPEPSTNEILRSDSNAQKIINENSFKKDISANPKKIVNPSAPSEVIVPEKPVKKTIKEVFTPEQQKIRDENKIQMDKFKKGEFNTDTEPNGKLKLLVDTQQAKINYKETDPNSIEDFNLRSKLKDALSFDKWAEENGITKADAKSDQKWNEVVIAERMLKNKTPEVKVEPKTEVKQPQIETKKTPVKQVATPLAPEPPKKPESSIAKDKQASIDELQASIKREAEISRLKKIEGIDETPTTDSKIQAGEIKASKKLKALIAESSEVGRKDLIEINPDFPKEKLKENYTPTVKKAYLSETTTKADGIGEMLDDTTYNPSKKRAGMSVEEMATAGEGRIEAKKAYLKRKYYVADQTEKLMTENNIPKEKEAQVVKFVESQKDITDNIKKEHIDKTKFGDTKNVDYIELAKQRDAEWSKITGVVKPRKVVNVKFTGFKNLINNFQNLTRGKALLFADNTNKEIYDAYFDFQDSQNMGTVPYRKALNRFINKLTEFDYAVPTTKEAINNYIDTALKEHKVVKTTTDKLLNGISEGFSLAQIGGNVKTMIQQPFETLRIIPELGFKRFLEGVKNAFKTEDSTRFSKEYGLSKTKSSFVAPDADFKQTEGNKISDIYNTVKDKVAFGGLQATENWKNRVFATAFENEGKSKGLKDKELRKFVMDGLWRTAHMASSETTPAIMRNNSWMSSLLQYSQYALKNELYKWNTITDPNLSFGKRVWKTSALFATDTATIGLMAGLTGVGVDGVKGYFANSALPNSLGPILTVPYQMGKEIYDFSQKSEEEQERDMGLMDREKAILFRNFMPFGNQITKTKGTIDVLDKGYAESRKGNVNYVAGDMNPIQTGQALIFGKGAIPNKKKADERWDNLKKDKIYPTLTSAESETLKNLPREEQEAYYNKKMELQKSAKQIIKEEEPKKKGIMSIFGKKESKAKVSVADILNSTTATQEERAKAKSIIKEKLDSGVLQENDTQDLKAYFFGEIDKMPESTDIEKQEKTLERWRKINSVMNSETLDKEYKEKIIKESGISNEDYLYYKDASLDNASRQQKLVSLASQEDRNAVIEALISAKRMVGGKALAGSSEIDYLYDKGLITKAEKNLINSYKFDEIKGEFYQDRDYKGSGGETDTKRKARITATLNALKTLNSKLNPKEAKQKSITDYLTKSKVKPQAKTVGSILASSKFKKKNTTQINKNSDTVKRVKRLQKLYK